MSQSDFSSLAKGIIIATILMFTLCHAASATAELDCGSVQSMKFSPDGRSIVADVNVPEYGLQVIHLGVPREYRSEKSGFKHPSRLLDSSHPLMKPLSSSDDDPPIISPTGDWRIEHKVADLRVDPKTGVMQTEPKDAEYSSYWVVSRDGRKRWELKTSSSESKPVWSPDGSSIAFTKENCKRMIFTIDEEWGLYEDIWMVNADGRNERRLASLYKLTGEGRIVTAIEWIGGIWLICLIAFAARRISRRVTP